jgi:hypothetical protein
MEKHVAIWRLKKITKSDALCRMAYIEDNIPKESGCWSEYREWEQYCDTALVKQDVMRDIPLGHLRHHLHHHMESFTIDEIYCFV